MFQSMNSSSRNESNNNLNKTRNSSLSNFLEATREIGNCDEISVKSFIKKNGKKIKMVIIKKRRGNNSSFGEIINIKTETSEI